jgi:hypothetical protein
VLVGVNHRIAPHSHLMEYGWVRLPAGKPFMRPAVTQKRRIMADSIGREIRKLVEKPIRR